MDEYQQPNIYSSGIFNLFIKENKETAGEYLKKCKHLSETDIDLLSHFYEHASAYIVG